MILRVAPAVVLFALLFINVTTVAQRLVPERLNDKTLANRTETPASTQVSPFIPRKGNIAASEVGGVIESITGEYGPGYNGNRLIDGRVDPAWKPRQVAFPQEIVFSFFNKQPALIDSVVITRANSTTTGPKDIEIWTSNSNSAEGFKKVAGLTLTSGPVDQTIQFEPLESRYVKLRILSSFQAGALEIGELQIIEGQGRGYVPLATRFPSMLSWAHSPRRGAQLGVEWLESASIDWQVEHKCFGCHAQAQVIMGLSVAKQNDYLVAEKALQDLVAFTQRSQNQDGSYFNENQTTATQFAAMGLAFFDDATRNRSPFLLKSCNWLIAKQQTDGEISVDNNEPPIDQGSIMTTANTALALNQAFNETGDARYKQGYDRALTWVASAKPETTQDEVFKVLAVSALGNATQRKLLGALVDQLKSEQKSDGGWQETNNSKGSNAFATGQVLYAFKQAAVSIDSAEFSKGVRYLLSTQKDTGFWPSQNSESSRPSDFAPTMWAVIGLAGSFHASGQIRLTLESAVLFDFNRYNLKPEAEAALARIKTDTIDKHPGARLIVEGHTDDVAGDAYNLGLSQRRAQSVADWLVQHGIKRSLIEVKGYGKTQPKVPNSSDENRARNRRVEIVVVE
jgi:outer membrane protein OmpA-like peptidoglycan-associated protein